MPLQNCSHLAVKENVVMERKMVILMRANDHLWLESTCAAVLVRKVELYREQYQRLKLFGLRIAGTEYQYIAVLRQ